MPVLEDVATGHGSHQCLDASYPTERRQQQTASHFGTIEYHSDGRDYLDRIQSEFAVVDMLLRTATALIQDKSFPKANS
jgi:hypothetical protein